MEKKYAGRLNNKTLKGNRLHSQAVIDDFIMMKTIQSREKRYFMFMTKQFF